MKKCKNCKQPFTPRFSFFEKFCWADDCKLIEAMQKLQLHKANEKKRIAKKKKELLTVGDWVKIAQQAFNGYIRQRDKGKQCISCDTILKGKFDAGHYYNANNHWLLRFDEDNVHGQCVRCNQHLHGNLINYRKGLLKRIGLDNLSHLEQQAHKTRKFTIEDLQYITEIYKQAKKNISM